MPAFHYKATTQNGTPIAGEVDATNLDEARGRLLERRLIINELTAVAVAVSPTRPLTAEQVDELVQHVARLASSGFPLAAGFRAAAREGSSEPVVKALQSLADRLERGQSLPDALRESSNWLPVHVAGLIVAGLKADRLAEVLVELVDQQRASRALRQRLWQSLAYPLIVGVLATVLLVLVTGLMANAFESVFRDFNLMLPLAARHLFWWRDTGIWIVAASAVVLVFVVVIFRRTQGPVAAARWGARIPLFGPLFYLRALAEWASLMRVLVKNHVTLPDALRWSADGLSNAWVAHNSRVLADEVTRGQRISDMLAGEYGFTNSLAPLIRWGETTGALADAFAASHEILERRLQLRAEMLRTVLPPLLFVAIAYCVIVVLVALFMPLIQLLNMLG